MRYRLVFGSIGCVRVSTREKVEMCVCKYTGNEAQKRAESCSAGMHHAGWEGILEHFVSVGMVMIRF